MKKYIAPALILIAALLIGQVENALAAGGGTITELDVFTITGGNITQRVANTPFKLTGVSDGCAQFASGILGSTGSACGSGGGGGTFGYPFVGNATSTTLTFGGGLVSNGSTTIAGLGSGFVGANNGKLYSLASSTITTLSALSLPFAQITGVPAFDTFAYPFINNATSSTLTFGAIKLSNVTTGTQCLHADSSGNVTGTGSDCGSGSGGVTNLATTYPLQTTGNTGSITLSTAFGTTSPWGVGNNGFFISGPTGIPFVAASSSLNLPNTALQNSSITVNSTAISLGSSGTITAASSTLLNDFNTFAHLITGSISGNAGTASALAANGTNCSAGNYALGVDASGNAEGCTLASLGTVTAVNGTASQINSSGGTTPTLSLPNHVIFPVDFQAAAGSTTNATSTNFSITGAAANCNGTNALTTNSIGLVTCTAQQQGTVTSVSGSGGTTGLTLTGGAITTSGTLTLGGTLIVANGGTGLTSTSQNFAFIGPTSGSGAPTWRALVAGDIPALSYDTFAYPFSATTFGSGVVAAATSSVLYPAGLVSGTSTIGALVASSSLTNQAVKSALVLDSATGLEGGYAGSAPCTNQVALSINASGVISCTSITDAMLSSTFVKTLTVSTANGFAGSFTTTATPVLTITTNVTGVLKGNGTAISAASNGTDFSLITANTCGAGQFFNAATAAGVFSCGTPSAGGGSSGGTWATTTSSVIGELINHPNNNSDVVVVGAAATTSAPFFIDPNPTAGPFEGIGSTSPFAQLSVHLLPTNSFVSTAFAIGSSTNSATTTLFSISNVGSIFTSLASGIVSSVSGVLSNLLLSSGFSLSGNTIHQVENRSFAIASSTWGVGTTTVNLESGYGETWNNVVCWAVPNGAKLNVDFYYHNNAAATHVLPFIAASSTNGITTFTTNNAIPTLATTSVDIGTASGAPTQITCTVNDTL